MNDDAYLQASEHWPEARSCFLPSHGPSASFWLGISSRRSQQWLQYQRCETNSSNTRVIADICSCDIRHGEAVDQTLTNTWSTPVADPVLPAIPLILARFNPNRRDRGRRHSDQRSDHAADIDHLLAGPGSLVQVPPGPAGHRRYLAGWFVVSANWRLTNLRSSQDGTLVRPRRYDHMFHQPHRLLHLPGTHVILNSTFC